MPNRIISINVGGTIFTTSTTSLTQDPESMLAKMCNTDLPHERDASGNIFLDRNPKTFSVIIEFLRTGKLFHEGVDCTLEQLEVEADYFGLVGLVAMIKQLKSPIDDGTRELILVMTSKGSISGPIFRLCTDGLASTTYAFIGVDGFKNALRNTFLKSHEITKSLFTSFVGKGEERDWREKKYIFFDGDIQHSIEEKRSVWFCIRDNTEETILPPTDVMMDMEAKILNDWTHFWKSAEDCHKTKKIKMGVMRRTEETE